MNIPNWNQRDYDDKGFEGLLGKKILRVEGLELGSDCIKFFTDAGVFAMFHEQVCCEYVCVTDITGDVDGLTRGPVTIATVTNDGEELEDEELEDEESYTWTFYTIGTVHGTVTIRWLGTSNGYYSEGVSFYRVKDA